MFRKLFQAAYATLKISAYVVLVASFAAVLLLPTDTLSKLLAGELMFLMGFFSRVLESKEEAESEESFRRMFPEL